MGTLARLPFWILPEKMDEFEAAYGKEIVPILKEHGLVESAERSRMKKLGIERM